VLICYPDWSPYRVESLSCLSIGGDLSDSVSVSAVVGAVSNGSDSCF